MFTNIIGGESLMCRDYVVSKVLVNFIKLSYSVLYNISLGV